MGTYGVTHIKKDDKIIPFSDSYDGYWSGMGLANLIGLKYVSFSKLSALFDSYSARTALTVDAIENFTPPDENHGHSLSYREFTHFIEQISVDTANEPYHQEAVNWATNIVQFDLRASSVGIVPLLYMNIHPHYGYDYDSCDYLIDLDKKVFVFSHIGLEIDFDLIHTTSVENIQYFFDYNIQLMYAKKHFNTSDKDFQSLFYDAKDEKEQQVVVLKMQEVIADIFSTKLSVVQDYFAQKENERLSLAAQYKEKSAQVVVDKSSVTNSYSYTIYTANVSSHQLRKIIFFLQEKAKNPEYGFMLDCAEWGLDEAYIEGGLRLVKPSDNQYQERFEEIKSIIENHFKQRFNIMSGAGCSVALSDDMSESESLDMADQSVQKSIFSFNELKEILSPDDFNLVMEQGLPYLAYHSYLDEAAHYLVEHNGKTNSPIFWIFVALLSQNQNLFHCMYPLAVEQFLTLAPTDIETVKSIYIYSYYDGLQVASLLKKESDFTQFLTTTTFFKDCETVLNDLEKKQFLIH